jgi:hypothetical protein
VADFRHLSFFVAAPAIASHRWRGEISIIPHPEKFVKRKLSVKTTKKDPKILCNPPT